jgi:acyl-coenzyme A thioesterase PaaI-like protein
VTKQPNSHMCFICGVDNPVGLKLKIYETEPGVIETNYTIPEHYQSYPGIVHGGIVATILDEISGRSLMGDPSKPRFMYTAKLEVKYRKNVPVGVPLKIVGKAGKSKGRMAEGWAGIYDPEGALLAEAHSLLIDIPQEVVGDSDLEKFGWKVYPD